MGAFSDVFGYIPKVTVLEAFAENPDSGLTAPEVARITGVSRRAVYLIVKHYLDEGILARFGKGSTTPRTYALNRNDLRAITIARMENFLTLGSIQAEIKHMRGIRLTDALPVGIVARTPVISTSIIRVLPNPEIAQASAGERVMDPSAGTEGPWTETTSSQSRPFVTIEIPEHSAA